jgi:hypothetical protein
MSPKDVAETAVAILASLGGGGAIVFGLSGYLGKQWADRSLAKQHQEYARLNIEFQSKVDVLGLVHKLRTQEEFTRLEGLWKAVANVQNYLGGLAQLGLTLSYEDKDEQRRWEAQNRRMFEDFLNNAQMFLRENWLFIPTPIAHLAAKALSIANLERHNYAGSAKFLNLDVATLAMSPGVGEIRKSYFEELRRVNDEFDKTVNELEVLMRGHIAGSPAKDPVA